LRRLARLTRTFASDPSHLRAVIERGTDAGDRGQNADVRKPACSGCVHIDGVALVVLDVTAADTSIAVIVVSMRVIEVKSP